METAPFKTDNFWKFLEKKACVLQDFLQQHTESIPYEADNQRQIWVVGHEPVECLACGMTKNSLAVCDGSSANELIKKAGSFKSAKPKESALRKEPEFPPLVTEGLKYCG